MDNVFTPSRQRNLDHYPRHHHRFHRHHHARHEAAVRVKSAHFCVDLVTVELL